MRLACLTLALIVCAVAAPAASAQQYKGSTAAWAELTATVADGQLTAFKTKTGRLQSCDGSGANPQEIVWTGAAVPVVGGKFHLEGDTKDTWDGASHWTADGTISLDGRELTGTIKAGGVNTFGKLCEGTWTFEAIIAPRQVTAPAKRTFTATIGSASYDPGVSFDFKRGVITHLTARVGVACASGSQLGAQLNTTAYGLDPIQVDKGGRFRIAGAVIDDYGVVTRYVLSGRISGRSAVGMVESHRPDITNGKTEVCSRRALWRAKAGTAAGASGPMAHYVVVPFRYGREGAFAYYLQVKMNGCTRANRARIAVVGGPSQTAGCRGTVRLGPLTPKRRYRVRVSALRTRGARVLRRAAAVASEVYLPGDDGNWIQID